MRVWKYLREHVLAVLLLSAILLSFAFTLHGARQETSLVRTKAIDICTQTGIAQALIVAFKQEVADDAGEDAAEKFDALARSGLRQIPLPADKQHRRESLAVVQKEGTGFDLLPEAKGLIRAGCTEAYDPS